MGIDAKTLHMEASALPLSYILSPDSFFKNKSLHIGHTDECNPKLSVCLLVHVLYFSQRYQKCHGPVRRKSLLGRGTPHSPQRTLLALLPAVIFKFCVYVGTCVHVNTGACGIQKRVLDSLETEGKVAMSHST